jgi:predicted  nucleic acid-binding Zn-ribbon protein
MKVMVRKPDVVEWSCRGCKWAINCEWHERNAVQTCPDCGCRQYVPGSAFAWNARLIHEREAKQREEEFARQQAAETARRQSEAAEQQRRDAAAAAERERQRQAEIVLVQLADVAAGAGLIDSKEDFRYLSPQAVANLKALSDLADGLHADLMSAMDDNVAAEKGVAYGRPAAAGASILSLLNGYGWVGLAFGALAVSARVISNDWKRAKMAEFQAKWTRILSFSSADELAAFTRVFAYKYPALASMAARMQGQLSD